MSSSRILIACLLCLTSTCALSQAVITEIMFNAASSETTTETQFIEIANVTAAPLDVSGWSIDDEDSDGPNVFPMGTVIPANGVLVYVGSSAADFTAAFASTLNMSTIVVSATDQMDIMINLSNSPSAVSEIVQLRDDMAVLVDEVNYDDTAPWPTDPGGVSIVLNLSNADIVSMGATANDTGSNWVQAGTVMGDGSASSVTSGAWNGIELTSAGNVNGSGTVPVELMEFTVE